MSLWGVNWSNDPVSEHYVELASGKFPSLMGMLCLAYSIHSAIITLLKNNARQENNSRDLAIGFSLVALTYTFVGTMVFISFPLSKNCIDQNFIKNLTSYDGMAIIARFFLFLQMSTVFPLLAFLFRVNFLYVLFKMQDFPGYAKVIALNLLSIGICAIIAIFYPNVSHQIKR
jgi:sodium-coupled neutral amino acid transporter 9